MKKIIAAAAAAVLFTLIAGNTAAQAQDKLKLNLESCIEMALSRNPNHLAAGQKIASAESMVREAAAGFFPSLNAQGTSTLDEKLFTLDFPSIIPGQPGESIEIDFTRDYQLTLALNFPLYTGGRLTAGFKQAQYNLASSREAVRLSRHETIYNTKQAFYGYLLAMKFVEVAEDGVKVAEKHLADVKNMYEVGLASKFDLLRSEVQAANLKPQLIRAKNSVKIAELGLKTLIGLDLNQEIEINGELSYKDINPDININVDTALKMRPELEQLNFQKKMAGEYLKMARAEYLPNIALSGTYNYWADKLSFGKNIWQDYYSVSLVFSLPIFNGFGTSARVAQAKIALRELDLVQKGLTDAVRFEVRQAILKIKEAKESLLSQEKNVEQAQESLRIAELNFAEGLASTLDVSTTQAALTQAKTNYAQALYDYMIAAADLEKAVGMGGKDEN